MDFINTIDVPDWVNLMGIIVASATGAMYAASFTKPKLDLLGIAMIGVSTGLGGGFLRDILLNRMPLAFSENYFILVAIASALAGMLLGRIMLTSLDWLINWLDAIALGTFAVLGTSAAILTGLPIVPALFVGVITAVGGGVIRDMMLNMPIAVMHVGSLYAMSAFVGCFGLEVLYHLGVSMGVSAVVGLSLTTVMRLLATRYGWSLPEQRFLRSLRDPRLVTPDELG